MKRFYRKILDTHEQNYQLGDETLRVKIVHWCGVNATTSRTVKTDHIACSVYINGTFKGISARHPKKDVSIRLKNPLDSKYYTDRPRLIEELQNDAFSDALGEYYPSLGRVEGEVLYFDEYRGEGLVRCFKTQRRLRVYACNIKGAKTWYSETACMSLKRGQKITFKHHEHCGAVEVTGGTFEAEKWASLDQDNLAFKCDDEGNAINGLFKGGK